MVSKSKVNIFLLIIGAIFIMGGSSLLTYYLTPTPQIDLSIYNDEISNLNQIIDSLNQKNKNLNESIINLQDIIKDLDNDVVTKDDKIFKLQKELEKKLKNIDNFTFSELQKFFSDRYKP